MYLTIRKTPEKKTKQFILSTIQIQPNTFSFISIHYSLFTIQYQYAIDLIFDLPFVQQHEIV